MRRRGLLTGSFVVLAALCVPAGALAAPTSITFAHAHHLITLQTHAQQWNRPMERWYYRGAEAVPVFCSDACDDADIPEGWTRGTVTGWDIEAIKETLRTRVASAIDREPGTVRIARNENGDIVFDGHGLTGRHVDIDAAAAMTLHALEHNVSNVTLPVVESQPSVSVDDPALVALGIREVVTVGESDFAGSPHNRRHNIDVGLSKFNGALIPQGAVFSFNEVLGPVNGQTGYLRELVIMGDRTIPDYGGGLCQVSSTAYRGIWEYGFPINERRNHSYIVQYYGPQGTDATIYPPHTDLKFTNDSPGALLIQTMTDEKDRAYFIYYGTRDERKAEVFGPYVWSTTPAPQETKIEYTDELAPGERRRIGTQVAGATTSWFRTVRNAPDEAFRITETYSQYQARPLFYQVGVQTGAPPQGDGISDPLAPPSWIPVVD